MLRNRFASTLEQKPQSLDDLPKLEGEQIPLVLKCDDEEENCNSKHVDELTLFERNRLEKVDQNKIQNKILHGIKGIIKGQMTSNEQKRLNSLFLKNWIHTEKGTTTF